MWLKVIQTLEKETPLQNSLPFLPSLFFLFLLLSIVNWPVDDTLSVAGEGSEGCHSSRLVILESRGTPLFTYYRVKGVITISVLSWHETVIDKESFFLFQTEHNKQQT